MLGFNINNLFKEFLLIITIYFLKTIFYVIVYLYVYFILTLYLSNKKYYYREITMVNFGTTINLRHNFKHYFNNLTKI